MILDLQKASLLKRASAFLLDAILLVVLATGFFYIISVVTGYEQHRLVVAEATERISQEYGVTAEMTSKSYEELTEAEIAAINAADKVLQSDAAACRAYAMVANLSTLIVSLGLLLAFVLLEFVVPLLFGNGQTLGKKIFGIAVMHIQGVKLGHVALFTRTVLGKYAVETMPLALSALYLISGLGSPVFLLIGAALLLVQLIVVIVSHENALLHDKMAVTVTVDLASQMIFDTYDQLLEYKKKMHAEKAASQPY